VCTADRSIVHNLHVTTAIPADRKSIGKGKFGVTGFALFDPNDYSGRLKLRHFGAASGHKSDSYLLNLIYAK
jgi:hypothetical protein